MDRETKNTSMLVKATNAATGTFEGYLAVFSNVDGNGDVIDQGAFTKTLATAKVMQRSTKSPFLWPLLWQHNEYDPIGGINDAYEDTHGLYIKAQLDLDTQQGQRAYSAVKKGYLTGLSIGYRTVKATVDATGLRHLSEIQLFEGSPVTFPANTEATVTSVKSLAPQQRVDRSFVDSLAAMELERKAAQQMEDKAVLMRLEAKAMATMAGPIGAEIRERDRRTEEIDTKRAKLRKAIAAMESLPDSNDTVVQLRKSLAELDRAWDKVNPSRAKFRAELQAIKARHELERKARARGERVPSIHDPRAYVVWLDREEMRPYVDLARNLNEQSRRSGQ